MKKYVIAGICAIVVFAATFFREDVVRYASVDRGALRAADEAAVVIFVGDVMLGRNVENLVRERGRAYPFEGWKSAFASADAVVANLEGPIVLAHAQTPSLGMTFSFASTTPNILEENGITAVTLANNHLYDQGSAGYDETVSLLSARGIAAVGHPFAIGGKYSSEISVRGERIVLAAYNFTNPKFPVAAALADIAALRASSTGAYLVAIVHGGEEYKLVSNAAQRDFYRKLIDAGADAVVAHHPHVTQEIELYRGKPIFYSLGNFVFDQYFSKDVQEGLALELTLSPAAAEYELIPVESAKSRPEPMAADRKAAWLAALAARSPESARSMVASGVIYAAR